MSREVMQQALDALEDAEAGHAAQILREALAQQEQEPVAWKQAIGSSNCMQCCVGYMLGLPIEQVPNFAANGGWDRFEAFAKSQGYASVMLPGSYEFEADYLASGTTARGTSHMVIMNDGKLVFDPHPSSSGLSSVQSVWLLAKRIHQPAHENTPEGCTPADARMLRAANHKLAQELHELKTQPAQQEPVAWIRWEWNRSGLKSLVFEKPAELSLAEEATGVVYDPLYAAPQPQRQPLTPEQIEAAYTPFAWVNLNAVEHRNAFARAVEAIITGSKT